ncbi:hypothetical protein V500_07614 [Pseudogymnoascus sp. VKM F-4518 (FW-2643)]|nr:hypothetical protein V500_07614 [Pseudogymnoascus sp. VKM F-4518 (FW-2643)]
MADPLTVVGIIANIVQLVDFSMKVLARLDDHMLLPFRWAVCQMDILGECRTRSALKNALKEPPTTLDETYERILCTINDADSEYAMRILQWLAFSSRPLSVEELAEVVAINVERETAFDQDEVLEDPMDVLNICMSLVSVVITEAASAGGYNKVVEVLLSMGANPNAQGGHYSNALYAASSRGYNKIVKALLSKGADVNAQGGHYGNAL